MANNNEYIVKISADIKNLKKDIKSELASVLREVDSVGDAVSKGITPDTKEFESKIASLESKMEKLANSTKDVEQQVASMKTAFKGFAELEAAMKVIGEQNKVMYETFVKMTPYLHEFANTFTAMKPEQAGKAFATVIQSMSASGVAGTKVFNDMQNAMDGIAKSAEKAKSSVHEVETSAVGVMNTEANAIETRISNASKLADEAKKKAAEVRAEIERINNLQNKKSYGGPKDSSDAGEHAKFMAEFQRRAETFDNDILDFTNIEEDFKTGKASVEEFNSALKKTAESASNFLSITKNFASSTELDKAKVKYADQFQDAQPYVDRYFNSLKNISTTTAQISKVELKPLKLKVDISDDNNLLEQVNKQIDTLNANNSGLHKIKIETIFVDPVDKANLDLNDENIESDKTYQQIEKSLKKQIKRVNTAFDKETKTLVDKISEFKKNIDESLKLKFNWVKGNNASEIQTLFDLVQELSFNNKIILHPDTDDFINKIDEALKAHEFTLKLDSEDVALNAKIIGGVPISGGFSGGPLVRRGSNKSPQVQFNQQQPSRAPDASPASAEEKRQTKVIDNNSEAVVDNTDAIKEVVDAFKSWVSGVNRGLSSGKQNSINNAMAKKHAMKSIVGFDPTELNNKQLAEKVADLLQNTTIAESLKNAKTNVPELKSRNVSLVTDKFLEKFIGAQDTIGIQRSTHQSEAVKHSHKEYYKFAETIAQMGHSLKRSFVNEGVVPGAKSLEKVGELFEGTAYTNLAKSAYEYADAVKKVSDEFADGGNLYEYMASLDEKRNAARGVLDSSNSTAEERESASKTIESVNSIKTQIIDKLRPFGESYEKERKQVAGLIASISKGFKFTLTLKGENGKEDYKLSFNDKTAEADYHVQYYGEMLDKMSKINWKNDVVSSDFSSTVNNSPLNLLYDNIMGKKDAVNSVVSQYNALDDKTKSFINTFITDMNTFLDETASAGKRWKVIEESFFTWQTKGGKQVLGVSSKLNEKYKRTTDKKDSETLIGQFLNTLEQSMSVYSPRNVSAAQQRQMVRNTEKGEGVFGAKKNIPASEKKYEYDGSYRSYRQEYSGKTKTLEEYESELADVNNELNESNTQLEQYKSNLEAVRQKRNDAYKDGLTEAGLSKNQRQALKDKYTDIKSEEDFGPAYEAAKKKYEDSKKKTNNLQSKVNDESKRIDDLDAQIQSNHDFMVATQARIDSVKNAGGVKQYIDQLNQQMQASAQYADNLREEANKRNKIELQIAKYALQKGEIDQDTYDKRKQEIEEYINENERLVRSEQDKYVTLQQLRDSFIKSGVVRKDGSYLSVEEYERNQAKYIEDARKSSSSMVSERLASMQNLDSLRSDAHQAVNESSVAYTELYNLEIAFNEEYQKYVNQQLEITKKNLDNAKLVQKQYKTNLVNAQQEYNSKKTAIDLEKELISKATTESSKQKHIETKDRFESELINADKALQEAKQKQNEINHSVELLTSKVDSLSKEVSNASNLRSPNIRTEFDKELQDAQARYNIEAEKIKKIEDKKSDLEAKIRRLQEGKNVAESPIKTMTDAQKEIAVKQEVEAINKDFAIAEEKIEEAKERKRKIDSELKYLSDSNHKISYGMRDRINSNYALAERDLADNPDYNKFIQELNQQIGIDRETKKEKRREWVTNWIDQNDTTGKYKVTKEGYIADLKEAQKVQQGLIDKAQEYQGELIKHKQAALAILGVTEEELFVQKEIVKTKQSENNIPKKENIPTTTQPALNDNTQFKSEKDLINAYFKQSGVSDDQIDTSIDSIGKYFNNIHQIINEKYATIDALIKECDEHQKEFFGTDDPYEKERIRKESVQKENERSRIKHEIEALEQDRDGLVNFINANKEYYTSSNATNEAYTDIISDIDTKVAENEQRIVQLQALIDAHPEAKDAVIGRTENYPYEVFDADLEIKKLKQRNEKYLAEKAQLTALSSSRSATKTMQRTESQARQIDENTLRLFDAKLEENDRKIAELRSQIDGLGVSSSNDAATKFASHYAKLGVNQIDADVDKANREFYQTLKQGIPNKKGLTFADFSDAGNIDAVIAKAKELRAELLKMHSAGQEGSKEYITLQRQLSKLLDVTRKGVSKTDLAKDYKKNKDGTMSQDAWTKFLTDHGGSDLTKFIGSKTNVGNDNKFKDTLKNILAEKINGFSAQYQEAAVKAYNDAFNAKKAELSGSGKSSGNITAIAHTAGQKAFEEFIKKGSKGFEQGVTDAGENAELLQAKSEIESKIGEIEQENEKFAELRERYIKGMLTADDGSELMDLLPENTLVKMMSAAAQEAQQTGANEQQIAEATRDIFERMLLSAFNGAINGVEDASDNARYYDDTNSQIGYYTDDVYRNAVVVSGDGSGPWALETTLGKTNEILSSINSKIDSIKGGSASVDDSSTGDGNKKKSKKPKIDVDTAKATLEQVADENIATSFGEGTKSVRRFNEDTLKLYETLTLANGETVKFTYSINKMDGSVKSSYTTIANFEKVAKQAYTELGKNNIATKQMFDGLNFPAEKVTAYNNAIAALDNKLKSLGSKGVTDPSDAAEVEVLTGNVKKLRTELEGMAKTSAKLANENDLVKTFDANEIDNTKVSMEKLAQEIYGAGITVNGFNSETNELTFSVKTGKNELTTLTYKFDELTKSVYKTGQASKTTTGFFKSFFSDVGSKISELARYYTGMSLLTEAFQRVRQGVQYVRDIDLALTELKKVTDESESSYNRFLQTMSNTASVVGSTVSELTNSAAAWARLGFSMEEAGELAKNTAILLNVSEFESEEQATEALISSLQAFNYEASDSIKIVDKLNIVGNNFAISSDGIAEGLSRSASTLVSAGNTLEESIAMLAAGNKVQQDPEGLGNALKVLSMRIRGTKTDLEEAGEETDGMIENTSKLRDKVMALTDVGDGGVDILTDTGAYKSTYQILLEIAEVWDRINEADPKNQAALLEILAGKTRGSQVASILQNPEDLKDAYAMALDSDGSAQQELETYLDSIQGRIDLFTNELQTFWMNLINSNVIKLVVDFGTTLLHLLNNIMDLIDGIAEGWGSLGVIIPAIIGAFSLSAFKKQNNLTNIFDIVGFIKNLEPVKNMLQNLSLSFKAVQLGAGIASDGLTGFAKVTAGLKGGLSTLAAGINPVVAGIVAVVAVLGTAIALYKRFGPTHSRFTKELKEETEKLNEIQTELKSVNNELKTTQDRISELENKGPLSFTEEDELARLRAQNDELERQEKILQAKEKREKQKQVESALNAVKTDPNLKDNNASEHSIAASSQYTSGTDFGNKWEVNLNALANAKIELEKAEDNYNQAILNGEDDKTIAELEKKLKQKQQIFDNANNTLDTLKSDWETKYGDVGYIEDATTVNEKAWNEHFREIQDNINKQAWINEDIGKADILSSIFGSYATDAAKKFKEEFENEIKKGKDPDKVLKELFTGNREYASMLNGLSSTYGITTNDIIGYLTQTGDAAEQTSNNIDATVTSLDKLTTAVESYKAALQVVNEITHDGQAISEDYYNTLKEQLKDVTVGSEDFSDAIDTSNGYIVKNTTLLKKLVAQSKNSQKATIQVAKAQAQLQYKELVQKIRSSIVYLGAQASAYGFVAQAAQDHWSVMQDQLDTLKQTIQQYALLELSLSSAANAFDEYEKAKERDAKLTYDDSMLEMLKTIDEGLLKNETGTEAFEYAVRAIVPEKFWKDIDDVDEKIKSIHDYIDGDNVFSRFFYVDEESGDLDITTDNVREFVDLCVDSGLFDGNSKDFALSNSVEGIEDFAKGLGVTESVALAMLTALEKVDAKWGNILTDVTMTPFDRKVNSAVKEIANANDELVTAQKNLADGTITLEEYEKIASEYAKKTATANANLDKYTKEAKTRLLGSDNGTADTSDDTLGFIELNKKVTSAQEDVEKSTEDLVEAQEKYNKAKESGATDEELKEYENAVNEATDKVNKHTEAWAKLVEQRGKYPTEYEIELVIADIDKELEKYGSKFDKAIEDNFHLDENGYYVINAGLNMNDLEAKYPGIKNYIVLLNSKTEIKTFADTTSAEEDANKLKATVDGVIQAIEDNLITLELDEEAVNNIVEQANKILSGIMQTLGVQITASMPNWMKTVLGWMGFDVNDSEKTPIYSDASNAPSSSAISGTRSNSTYNINRRRGATVYAQGSDGLKTNERNAVVGELGQELVVDPERGVYYTVGDNGTEMVNLPKGAIIYNHKQTEELLKKGHTSRGNYTGGLSFASGNAHEYGIPSYHPNLDDKTSFANYTRVNNKWDDATSTLLDSADKLDDASDSLDEFKETINWIEVLFTRIDNILAEHEAYFATIVDSTGGIAAKESVYNSMYGQMYNKASYSLEAAQYYQNLADTILAGMDAVIAEKVRTGTILIEEITDEALKENIDKALEYLDQKSQYEQQYYQTITEIADKAKEHLDEVAQAYENEIGLAEHLNDTLEARNDLEEAREGFATKAYYNAQIDANKIILGQLEDERDALQNVLDEEVRLGNVKIGDQQWFEMQQAIYDVDDAIIDTEASIEDLQNSINDLHWDRFDELINRFEYVEEEISNVIQLLSHDPDGLIMEELRDLTTDNWATESGLTTIGLYAQEMERAQYVANEYAQAIKDLKRDYAAGKYNETEYLNKLNELISAQYENIEKYYDAKDAIIELNEARVDAIRDGIEKEIDAYQDLIDKKKELLDSEQALHDFQNEIAEKEKEVSDIRKQLAAMAGDTTAATTAKRKQLEAELIEAQKSLEESYYSHSMTAKQEALDKEFSSFEEEKNAEIAKWEEWLTETEIVVSEALTYVKENTNLVYAELTELGSQYGLTLSETLTTPWQNGQIAIDNYSTTFEEAKSAFTDMLDEIALHWENVTAEAERAARAQANALQAEYNKTANSVPSTTNKGSSGSTNNTSKPSTTPTTNANKPATNTAKTIKVGGKINAGSAQIYDYAGDTSGERQYYRNDPVYTVLKEQNGWLQVRYHKLKSGITGWFKKSDVKAYAKGTLGTKKDEWALIDELGDELLVNADGNGRLSYLTKGTGVVPADLTEKIMKLALDPTSVLDDVVPKTRIPSVTANNFDVNLSFDSLVHADNVTQDTLPELQKVIRNEFDYMMKQVNNGLKRAGKSR